MSTLDVVDQSPLRISPVNALAHGFALAGRGVVKIAKSPEVLADAILTPVIFLLMFYYLFGGAISDGNPDGYLRVIVPGCMVLCLFQASVGIGTALNADASTGVFDRFRSLPIARSAPLVGAVLADLVRYVVCLAFLIGLALLLGYRGSVTGVMVGSGLAIAFGLSFSWISVYLGMLLKTPVAVQGLMSIVVLPLTFASNVFVPAETMPGWLETWSDVNPVSLMSDTLRGLMNGGDVAGPLTGALGWMAGIVLVFFPLAMRAYRRKSA